MLLIYILVTLFSIPSFHEVRKGIDWLCTEEYKAEQDRFNTKWGKHPLVNNNFKNIYLKNNIENAIVVSSIEHQIDSMYILMTLWRESKLVPKVARGEIVGKRGERGLGQQHGLAARGCDFETVEGQIDCTAKYLKFTIDKCGSIESSINYYRTGSTCKMVKGTKSRIDLLNRLRKAVK